MRMHGRMMVGCPLPSSYAQKPCTSAFRPPMVRWEDDLQILLKIKQKHLRRTVVVLRGADDSVNGRLYATGTVSAVLSYICL